MKIKTIRFIKGKVVLIVLAFCMLSFGGIIFFVIKSLKLDKEHLTLVEYSKNIEIDVFQSRIKLDDYFLINDTTSKSEILAGLQRSKKQVISLNSLNKDETKINCKNIIRNFGESLSKLEEHINRIEDLILIAFREEKTTIDSLIIQEYSDFQHTFLEFEKNLHDYISKRNSNFKGKIFTLLISSFGFLILCLILIIRLINAYYLSERQHVDKSLEIEYKERKRIAADLHDGLGSLLSSIGLYINLLEKEMGGNILVKDKLSHLKQLFEMALESLENAINNLNPSTLNKYGLVKSLESICNKLNDLGNIYFHVNSENFNIKISKNTEVNLYRISSELINNTLKHSGASEAKIELNNKKKIVFLYYSDNGIGFNPSYDYSKEGKKTGLHNIIRRVETLGGNYSIISEPGKGVKIFIQFKIG